MARPRKGKATGVGASGRRSETVTVRLDPKLRYFAELAARKQRRTLSSFVEWAIDHALDSVVLGYSGKERKPVTVKMTVPALWDVAEPERFVKLATRYPELLTHDEQVLWKLIQENGYIWRGDWFGADEEWSWLPAWSNVIVDRLRDTWEIFCKVASGEAPASKLPDWPRTKSSDGIPAKAIKAPDPDLPF